MRRIVFGGLLAAGVVGLMLVGSDGESAAQRQRRVEPRRERARGAQRQRRRRRPVRRRGRRDVRVPVRPQSPREKEAEERRKEEQKQRNRDLAHWRGVLRGEPTDEQRQRALFHLGAGYAATEKWPAAVESLETLVEESPHGAWSGDALVRLIDLKLEREADLAAAEQYAEQAVAWVWNGIRGVPEVEWDKWRRLHLDERTIDVVQEDLRLRSLVAEGGVESDTGRPERGGDERGDGGAVGPSADRTVGEAGERARDTSDGGTIGQGELSGEGGAVNPARESAVKAPAAGVTLHSRGLLDVAYDAYRRAGLLRYARGRTEEAGLLFRKAGPRRPGSIDEGTLRQRLLERLAFELHGAARRAEKADDDADADAAALLALADRYLDCRMTEHALLFCSRVISGRGMEPSSEQTAHARYLRGRLSLSSRAPRTYRRAAADLLAAQRMAPEADWAPRALFLAGNLRWNRERDAEAAVKLWRQVLEAYPGDDYAERSAYYIGIAYELSEQYAEAKTAYEDLLEYLNETYPDPKDKAGTRFKELVTGHLKEVERKLR